MCIASSHSGARNTAGCADKSALCFLAGTVLFHPLTASLGLGCQEVQSKALYYSFPQSCCKYYWEKYYFNSLLCSGKTFITKSVQWIKEDLVKPKQENLNHLFSIHSEITSVNIFVSICLDILLCLFIYLFFLQKKKKRNEKENTWHFNNLRTITTLSMLFLFLIL